MKIYLGSDHRGFEKKHMLSEWLEKQGYEVLDMGASEHDAGDDYVDYAKKVVEKVQSGGVGILLCGNGVGMSMAANRYQGVRCALGFSKKAVREAREHNDVNCLALPADYLEGDEVKDFVETFLKTEYSGEDRFKRRLAKLSLLGGGECPGGVCKPKKHD